MILTVTTSAGAQSGERYENPELGIAFDLPTGWEVYTTHDSLAASTQDSLRTLARGGVPRDLVFRVITSTFVEMNIQNAADLPAKLTQTVPRGVTAPQPIEAAFGNAQGWEIEYTIPESNLTSRVGILSLSNGRLALIRGIAASDVWQHSAGAQYEAIKASLEFSVPASMANPFANLPDGDGGVLWHYQANQPLDAKPITLGGVTYDPFLLMYVAAGERGILVLDQTNGQFVNYLGPFFEDDNFVDIAISADARLYVANATSGDNNQIMIVNRSGSFEYGFGSTGDGAGQFAPGMPRTLAVTSGREPTIWTVSEGHTTPPVNRLYHFDRWGNLLNTIDIDTLNPALTNIKLDNNWKTGGLYLVGETGGLNLLDFNGELLVSNLGTEVFSLTKPVDIAIAPNDDIIIATDSEGFLEFVPSGALLDRFGFPVDGSQPFQPGQTRLPGGLIVGIDGVIYFAETSPVSGLSQVQAFRFTGDGALPLPNRSANSQEIVAPLNLDPAAGGGNIAYGAVVQGHLNNQYPSHDWYFEGEAGDRLRITMRDISPEGTLDTCLVLIDPNLVEIASNDDIASLAPEGFKASDSVIEFEIRAFGFYTIRATRFGGRGEYELTLEKLSP
jgi:hypothetical protein